MIPTRNPNQKPQVEWTDEGIRIIFHSDQDCEHALKRWRLGKGKRGVVAHTCLHSQVDSFGNPIDRYYLDIKGYTKKEVKNVNP